MKRYSILYIDHKLDYNFIFNIGIIYKLFGKYLLVLKRTVGSNYPSRRFLASSFGHLERFLFNLRIHRGYVLAS